MFRCSEWFCHWSALFQHTHFLFLQLRSLAALSPLTLKILCVCARARVRFTLQCGAPCRSAATEHSHGVKTVHVSSGGGGSGGAPERLSFLKTLQETGSVFL